MCSIPIKETIKIGILFVDADQSNEVEILGNEAGSDNYHKFLKSVGQFFRLKGSSRYVAGLDTYVGLVVK